VGEGPGHPLVSRPLDRLFPQLTTEGYEVTSPESPRYNCIAWALGQVDAWWWPDPMEQGYWPEGVVRQDTLEAFIEVFGTYGFSLCEHQDLEPGHEKIAIYVNAAGKPTHVARQLSSGRWTSKLGRLEDIEPMTPESLSGSTYGSVRAILKGRAESTVP